jgi:hypothetical protein
MKNKGISLLLLLLGGAAVYYIIKNKKPKLKGKIIIDPLDKGEFPDPSGKFPSDYEEFPMVPHNATTEQVSMQLNSQMQPQPSILQQIKNMAPVDTITYQTYYKPDINAEQQKDAYQTMYANIGGQKMGVPYCV